jgi:hypothetical protein
MAEPDRTTPILTRVDDEEYAALLRFIREERPGMGKGDAIRLLAREQLIGMGLLPLGPADRARGARGS